MSHPDGELPGSLANVVFIVGACRPGTTMLYKLLCLHPDVAYTSSLEHRIPWLPLSLAGRHRLRRYSAKLRHWFREGGHCNGTRRALVSWFAPMPVAGEVVYVRCRLPLQPEPDYEPDPRVVRRLRAHFLGLQEAQQASVVASTHSASDRLIPALHATFPLARYVNLVGDGRDVAETEEMVRGLKGVDPSRMLTVRFEALLEAPIEEMRRVLAFVGLERRLDYEWALKALKLGDPSPAWRSAWSTGQVALVNREQGEHLNGSGYAS